METWFTTKERYTIAIYEELSKFILNNQFRKSVDTNGLLPTGDPVGTIRLVRDENAIYSWDGSAWVKSNAVGTQNLESVLANGNTTSNEIIIANEGGSATYRSVGINIGSGTFTLDSVNGAYNIQNLITFDKNSGYIDVQNGATFRLFDPVNADYVNIYTEDSSFVFTDQFGNSTTIGPNILSFSQAPTLTGVTVNFRTITGQVSRIFFDPTEYGHVAYTNPEVIRHTSGTVLNLSNLDPSGLKNQFMIVIDPSTTLSDLTINIPSTFNAPHRLYISFGGLITAGSVVNNLVWTGPILFGGTLPASANAGDGYIFIKDTPDILTPNVFTYRVF